MCFTHSSLYVLHTLLSVCASHTPLSVLHTLLSVCASHTPLCMCFTHSSLYVLHTLLSVCASHTPLCMCFILLSVCASHTPLCLQASFIEYVVYPLWEAWSELVYPHAGFILERLTIMMELWNDRIPRSPLSFNEKEIDERDEIDDDPEVQSL